MVMIAFVRGFCRSAYIPVQAAVANKIHWSATLRTNEINADNGIGPSFYQSNFKPVVKLNTFYFYKDLRHQNGTCN